MPHLQAGSAGDTREIHGRLSVTPRHSCVPHLQAGSAGVWSGASGELLRRGTGDRGTRDSEVRDFASRRVTSELCLVREVRCVRRAARGPRWTEDGDGRKGVGEAKGEAQGEGEGRE